MFRHNIYIADKKLSFKEVFAEYYASQVHFAYKIIKNRHDAEDVVQDVFLGIWRSKPSFKNEIAFRAYLYLSTKNRSIDFLKKKSPLYSDVSVFEDIEHEADAVVKEEAFRLLDRAIERLPNKTKEVIRLSIKGLSIKEVAQELSITVNTVKTHKLRAYRFLKEIYGRSFILLYLSIFVN